MGRIHSTN